MTLGQTNTPRTKSAGELAGQGDDADASRRLAPIGPMRTSGRQRGDRRTRRSLAGRWTHEARRTDERPGKNGRGDAAATRDGSERPHRNERKLGEMTPALDGRPGPGATAVTESGTGGGWAVRQGDPSGNGPGKRRPFLRGEECSAGGVSQCFDANRGAFRPRIVRSRIVSGVTYWGTVILDSSAAAMPGAATTEVIVRR